MIYSPDATATENRKNSLRHPSDWNGTWRRYLISSSNRTREQILQQLHKIILENFHNGAL